jgi:hypothetical protein
MVDTIGECDKATTRARQIADQAIAAAVAPLEVMLANMRLPNVVAGKCLGRQMSWRANVLAGMTNVIAGTECVCDKGVAILTVPAILRQPIVSTRRFKNGIPRQWA